MKQLKLASLFLAGSVALTACTDEQPTAPAATTDILAPSLSLSASGTPATDNFLVVFKKETVPAGFAQRVADLGGSVLYAYDAVGGAVITGVDAADIAALQADADVSLVEPESFIPLPEPQGSPDISSEPAASLASATNPAEAYFFPRQWHLRAIGADKAWAAGKLGSEDVVVAILDTGIDYTYPDLQGRVDLSRSVSFQSRDDLLVAAYFPGRHPISDLHYHGTHVAATVVSNGIVNAGVTSKTTLFGVKVCSVYGGCNRIFDGIKYAADNGADIINMSLGGGLQKRVYPGYVSLVNRWANYARQKGALLVVSAGNDANDLDHNFILNDNGTPTNYSDDFHEKVPGWLSTYCDASGVACISATGPRATAGTNGPWTDVDAPSSYTNYGRSAITVAAPGGNGAGRVYAGCSKTSLVYTICQTGNYVLGINGTSMAAPHASGVAALLVAEHGKVGANRLRTLLQQTSDDLGQSGTDPYYGKGRVNAARAAGVN